MIEEESPGITAVGRRLKEPLLLKYPAIDILLETPSLPFLPKVI